MRVDETLMHIRVTVLLLWIGISLCIPGLSQARPSQYFTSPEVVIPLKVITRGKGAEALSWLSYSLRFGGQRHVVHMKAKKLLVSPHLPVLTYTEQHALHQDHPFVQDDCYYHGFVEGVPESLVALSTCSGGLQGMLQINEFAYEIEPIKLSATFEHLLHEVDINETQFPPMRCGLTEETIARQLELQLSYNFTLKQSSYMGWWTHKRFVELGVVVDHVRFLFSQSNVSIVQSDVFNVVNIVDSLYYPLEVEIILTGIEVWTTVNQISTNTSLDVVLEAFSVWKHIQFDSQLHHDAAHLFIKELHGAKLGVAYVKGMCRTPYNSGVDVFEDNRLTLFAITVSHEVGHNLGMMHDTQWCVCALKSCIMDPYRKLSNQFSNCSYADYWDNAMNECIYSPPNARNILKLKHCGNQIPEEGEECDCGTVDQCAKDPCCLFNCTFSPGASCASGHCCKDCKLMPPGTLCREKVSECDLPEWCNGTSPECPDDVYVQDGIPCTESAYCYDKRCNSHDLQCKEIFGTGARSASQSCYNKVNTQGNRFGHCGIVGTTYIKCLKRNIMCGRVQCENVSSIPILKQHSTVYQFHFHNNTCWGTDHHLGMSIPDIGHVKDGTSCAPGKICIGKKCASIDLLPKICQSETCNMRGVCNNKHHCHCDQGWSPPDCKNKGSGGSQDSGPPPEISKPVINIPGSATGNGTGNATGNATGYGAGNVIGNATRPATRHVTGNALTKRSQVLLWSLTSIVLFLCCILMLYMGLKRKLENTAQNKEGEKEQEEGKKKRVRLILHLNDL